MKAIHGCVVGLITYEKLATVVQKIKCVTTELIVFVIKNSDVPIHSPDSPIFDATTLGIGDLIINPL